MRERVCRIDPRVVGRRTGIEGRISWVLASPPVEVPRMKCAGCGVDLAENARKCSACGREVGLGTLAREETVHVAKETGEVAEKVGKSVWGGMKSVGAAAKKELKRHPDEKQS